MHKLMFELFSESGIDVCRRCALLISRDSWGELPSVKNPVKNIEVLKKIIDFIEKKKDEYLNKTGENLEEKMCRRSIIGCIKNISDAHLSNYFELKKTKADDQAQGHSQNLLQVCHG